MSRWALGPLLVLGWWGCASPSVASMIPTGMPARLGVADRTLRVAEVTGEVTRLPMGIHASNDQVREVLSGSLERAGIFRAAGKDVASDLELKADIVVQKVTGENSHNELLVSYRLVETASGKVVWRAVVQSQADSNTTGGAQRLTEICEWAVRDNVAVFLQALSDRFPASPVTAR